MRACRILTPVALSLALAGLGASAAQAAPSQVTPQECIEAGGRVAQISAEVSICVGGDLSGQLVESAPTNTGAGTGTGLGAGSGTGLDTGSDTGAGTGLDTGTEAGAGADTGTGPGTGTGTEAGVGTGSTGVGQDGVTT